MENTPFRELWIQFNEQELLTNLDELFLHAPTSVKESLCNIHLSKGEKLINQGTKSIFVYLILEGEFVVNKLAVNGKQLGLTFCYRGEFLGEMEALCFQDYRYDVIALSDSRVIRISSQSFLAWLSQENKLSLLLNRQLAKRLLINGEQRLMNAVDSIENNLLYMLENIREQQINLPREVLASILCTSRRHLDKVILRLKEQNQIAQQGNKISFNNTKIEQ